MSSERSESVVHTHSSTSSTVTHSQPVLSNVEKGLPPPQADPTPVAFPEGGLQGWLTVLGGFVPRVSVYLKNKDLTISFPSQSTGLFLWLWCRAIVWGLSRLLHSERDSHHRARVVHH